MPIGRIVNYYAEKRFGFINPNSEFMVFPASDVTKDGFRESVAIEIEKGFSIIVPGIRDEIPRELRSGGEQYQAFNNLNHRLKKMFGHEYIVERKKPFPSTLRPNSTHYTKHPSLEEICPYMYIVRKKDVFFRLEDHESERMGSNLRNMQVKFQTKDGEKGPEAHQIELLGDSEVSNELPLDFMHHIYRYILKRDKDSWVILGDETGDLSEFLGRNPENHTATMCWVAIPPNSALPALHPSFHVFEGVHFFDEATSNLLENNDVKMFQFKYKSGEEIHDVPGPSNQPHLILWKDTLPLVLSKIAELCNEPTDVKIYIENVGQLSAGMPALTALIPKWKKSMGKAWDNIVIKDSKILAKNPLEHPWLGYPDALGYLNSGRVWDDVDLKSKVLKLEERVRITSYRQNSLERVNRFFTAPHSHEDFVKSLFELEQRDIDEYVNEFLGPVLDQHLDSMSQTNWRNLLEYMEGNSESLQAQNAINVIFQHCDFNRTLENLKLNVYKFNFLMAVLGSSNHSGDTEKAKKCKMLIDGLFESGFTPESHRRRHYNNLANGANDNEFDFELNMADVEELFNELEDDNALQIKINRKLAGAYAMSLALGDEPGNLAVAWGLEKKIRDYVEDTDPGSGDFARRLNLQSELYLAQEEYEQARNHIEYTIPEKTDRDLFTIIERDGFLLSALMRACVHTNQSHQKYIVYSSYVPALLNQRHPSQRIAFWTARWAWQLGLTEDSTYDLAIQHLLSLSKQEIFQKEAPGIILACELLDLKHRGCVDFDAEGFLTVVLGNSSETTQQWVAQRPPNQDDWLAPLTYNYR